MCGKLCFFIAVMCLAKGAVFDRSELSCQKNIYPYTGTKTAYYYAHYETGDTMTLEDCQPVQIWMLNTGGMRYPSESNIARIQNLTHIRDLILAGNGTCAKFHERTDLKNWKPCPEMAVGKGKHLALQGEKDLESLATRIKEKLPGLFKTNATNYYKFRSTASQHTIASMESFMKGVLDYSPEILPTNGASPQFESMNVQKTITKSSQRDFSNTSIKLEVVPIVNDILLKPYDICVSWKNERKKYKEMHAFLNGPEMMTVLANIGQRLGLPISREDARLFYNACRFEKALHPDKPSPWCDVFTHGEMRIFEYVEDLLFYYDVGPGQKLSGELGCHLVQDMLDHFAKLEELEEPDDEPMGVFYFAHSYMMSLFLTTMGIAKDPRPITPANFLDMSERNWRVSQLVPSAANFAAIFHRCESSDDAFNYDYAFNDDYANDVSFKVTFYLNENPEILEGCSVNGVCDWAQLKKQLAAIAANCSAEACKKVAN
ncbi:PREDICTED: multiple inositol polyphosphate phosphatase 1-like [Wasmannia auropunctata]|uniref:multiple inositol polyphosphate phosphatase 1-like n=1 Tax=Wasmannia auropunctata TaxID=64793 RepID=UPI0005EE9899|nr:PREDICTED: multiple inositol polyphosphate phosphatase 1-like [Wasmannia auropunctata]